MDPVTIGLIINGAASVGSLLSSILGGGDEPERIPYTPPSTENLDKAREAYAAALRRLQSSADPMLANLRNEAALDTLYDSALRQARGKVAQEYAARGLSGSGEYAGALASMAANLELQKQQALQERLKQALQIESGLADAYGRGLGMEGNIYSRQLQEAAQAAGIDKQNLNNQMGYEAGQRERLAGMFSGLGQLGGGLLNYGGQMQNAEASRELANKIGQYQYPSYLMAPTYSTVPSYSMAPTHSMVPTFKSTIPSYNYGYNPRSQHG